MDGHIVVIIIIHMNPTSRWGKNVDRGKAPLKDYLLSEVAWYLRGTISDIIFLVSYSPRHSTRNTLAWVLAHLVSGTSTLPDDAPLDQQIIKITANSQGTIREKQLPTKPLHDNV